MAGDDKEKELIVRALDKHQEVLTSAARAIGGEKAARDIHQAQKDYRMGNIVEGIGGTINADLATLKHLGGKAKEGLEVAADKAQRAVTGITRATSGEKAAGAANQALGDLRKGNIKEYIGGVINTDIEAIKHLGGKAMDSVKSLTSGGENTAGPDGSAPGNTPVKVAGGKPQGMAKPESKTSR